MAPRSHWNLTRLHLTHSMAQDWRLSWLLPTSLAPAVEERAEVAWGKLAHSLCALPRVVKSMMQLTGASQRQHGPCKNIQGVYQFRNQNSGSPYAFLIMLYSLYHNNAQQSSQQILYNYNSFTLSFHCTYAYHNVN